MFWVNEFTLFVFLRVNVAWQIQHIVPILIFHFLGVPGTLGLPLKLSWGHSQALSRSSWLGFALLLPIGISSTGLISGCFVLATLEPIFFFTVCILGGNF